jgi:hypothetical protein
LSNSALVSAMTAPTSASIADTICWALASDEAYETRDEAVGGGDRAPASSLETASTGEARR